MNAASPLPRTLAVIEAGMADALHIGAQLYVSHNGVARELAVGESRRGVAMTPDTLMLWLSAGKPVAAIAIAQLWERRLLDLDDPVARHLPAFAQNAKQAVTLRHLLTHTGGLRPLAANWNTQPWDTILGGICAGPLEPGWIPGQKAGYHVASSWFVLGELVRRIDGRPFDRYVREMIFAPLAMPDSFVGMPADAYRAYGDRIGIMHDTAGPEVRPQAAWDTQDYAALCRPGANSRGPIRQLGRLYEMLLARGTLDGVQLLLPQTVEALTARHRVGMRDHTFNHVMDWGLGFILNSALYGPDTVPYGFGPHASLRTFGHGGFQSSTGFCDPEARLVVACVFNGTAGEPRHHARLRALTTAIYEDLDLAHPTTP